MKIYLRRFYLAIKELFKLLENIWGTSQVLSLEKEEIKNEEVKVDKKIKKILKKEKSAVKGTKELLKMDKKQDKKIEKMENQNKK